MKKRGSYRTDGVVLNAYDYGESDRIVVFYTQHSGKIRGIAKGAKRSRRRFVGNLEPLTHIRLDYFFTERSELVRVEHARVVGGFDGLKADIDKFSVASYFLELVGELTPDGHVNPSVLALLLGSFKMLEHGDESDTIARFFEIRLLALLGYMPQLKRCVVCGTDADSKGGSVDKHAFFSSARGGMVCNGCVGTGMAGVEREGLLPLSKGTAAFLSMAARLDSTKLLRLAPSGVLVKEAEVLLYDFIRHQLGKELKTKSFIEQMRSVALV